MSMMQLPLISQSVMGLPPAQYPPAIALNNMMRQLGGAFGIAISNNFIANHYAQHRADLIANVYATNPATVERLNLLKSGIIAKTGDVATAADQALMMMNRMVDKQAYLLSYLDTFRMLSYFFIGLLPLVFLIRRPKVEQPAEAKEAAMEAH
jgi:DHA2 family multidrug resistance protein